MSDFTNVRLAASSSLKNVVFPDTFEWENNFKCFFQIVMHKKLVKATRSGTIQRPLRSLWRVENKTISTKIFLRVFLFFFIKAWDAVEITCICLRFEWHQKLFSWICRWYLKVDSGLNSFERYWDVIIIRSLNFDKLLPILINKCYCHH